MTSEIMIDTGKSTITLDELGSLQPGMARLMDDIAIRMGNCYHAAMAKNWQLARYMFVESMKSMRASMVTRPKYADAMRKFIAEDCLTVLAAIEKNDMALFEETFAAMTDAANRYHRDFKKGYIHWQVPDGGPSHLRLDPEDD